MTRSDSLVFLFYNGTAERTKLDRIWGDLHRIELMWGLNFQIVSRPGIPVLHFWQVTETDRVKAGVTHTESRCYGLWSLLMVLIDGRWADDRWLVTGVFSSGQLIDVDRPYESGFCETKNLSGTCSGSSPAAFLRSPQKWSGKESNVWKHLSMHSKESMHAYSCIHIFKSMSKSGEETSLIWYVQPGQASLLCKDANGAAAEALRRLLAGFLSAAPVTWIHVVSQFWLCTLYPTLFLLDL